MRYGKHRFAVLDELPHFGKRLSLKSLIADGEDLVDDQDIGIDFDGDGKGKAHGHPARVSFERLVDEFVEAGEVDNRLFFLVHFAAFETEEGAVQVNVLAAGKFGMEAGAEIEERGDFAVDTDAAFVGSGDTGDETEERTLPRPVGADDRDALAALDAKADALESVEVFGAVAGQPAVQIAAQEFALGVAREDFGDAVKLDAGQGVDPKDTRRSGV